jgi:hypothetical protein
MAWIGAVAAAVIGGAASMSAADKQAKAAQAAGGLSQAQYDQIRADLTPYREGGKVALSELQGRMPELLQPFGREQFQESPAYQFNLEQGTKALEKAAAKRGTYYAPATLQDIGKYSQGVASNEFQNAFGNYQTNMGNIWNRLYGLTGMGQSAANQTGAFGQNAANTQGGLMTDAGAARAAGTVGAANAFTGAYNDYQNQQLLNNILAKNQQSSVSSSYNPSYGPT